MERVRDKALGIGEQADRDLAEGEREICPRSHQCRGVDAPRTFIDALFDRTRTVAIFATIGQALYP